MIFRKTTYSVLPLQEGIPQNIQRHIPTALNAAIDIPIPSIRESKILLLHCEALPVHIKLHNRQLGFGDIRRKHESHQVRRILCTRNLLINRIARIVVNQCEGCAGIGNCSVILGSLEGLAIDGDTRRLVLPPTARWVNFSPIDLATTGIDSGLVNVTKCVEAFTMVWLVGLVAPAAEFTGEELGGGGDVVLGDQVVDWSSDWFRGDGVDVSEGEAEEARAFAFLETRGEVVCELDALFVNCEAAESDRIFADGATS